MRMLVLDNLSTFEYLINLHTSSHWCTLVLFIGEKAILLIDF